MRIVAYLWVSPITAVGLAVGFLSLLTGGSLRVRNGVAEAIGGVPGRLLLGNRFWHGGAAMTLGHAIIARDFDCLNRSRPHEMHHVRQFERWGPLLLPIYWLTALWLRVQGQDPYLDNPFEPPPAEPLEPTVEG